MQLVHHVLQPFLKFTPVLRAGHHTADIQAHDPFPHQQLRHIALHNALRQAFGHGALAHAGLTDQHRIILRPPDQDLDNPLNLRFTADHRIQFILLRGSRQIPAVFLQLALVVLVPVSAPGRCKRRESGHPAGRLFVSCVLPHLPEQLLPRGGQIDACFPEQAAGHPVIIPQQCQPDMFNSHIVLSQLMGFQHAVFQRLLRPGAQFNPAAPGFFRITDFLQVLPQLRHNRVIAHPGRNGFRYGSACLQQGEQEMLCSDIRLLQLRSDPLGQHQGLLGSLGKTTEYRHGKFLSVIIFCCPDGTEHRAQQAPDVSFHQVRVHFAHTVGTQMSDRSFFTGHYGNRKIRFIHMAFFAQHFSRLFSLIGVQRSFPESQTIR